MGIDKNIQILNISCAQSPGPEECKEVPQLSDVTASWVICGNEFIEFYDPKIIPVPPLLSPAPPFLNSKPSLCYFPCAAQPVCLMHSLNRRLETVSYVSHYLKEQVNLHPTRELGETAKRLKTTWSSYIVLSLVPLVDRSAFIILLSWLCSQCYEK